MYPRARGRTSQSRPLGGWAALARFDNRPPGRRKRPYRGWGKWPRKPPRRRDGEAPFTHITHKNTDNAFTE